jgi:hypothetical protein
MMHGTAFLNKLQAILKNRPTGIGSENWIDVAHRCGTDQVGYMHYFWDHLHNLETTAFTLLEIGVFHGQSLKLWKTLFPKAKIYALDINPECARYTDLPRVKVTVGSQNDPATLEEWTNRVSDPIDVIIDDGSHVMEHLKTSFIHLFPKLRPGGIYILEDLGTCYMPEYGGALRKHDTMIELLKSFIDNINENWAGEGNPLEIGQLHFHPNICFVYKK